MILAAALALPACGSGVDWDMAAAPEHAPSEEQAGERETKPIESQPR